MYNRHMEPRVCDVCGKDISDKRAGARYCSGGCRMKAMRARQAKLNDESKPRPGVRRRPLPDRMHNAVYDLERKAERVAKLTSDDRWPKHRAEFAQANRWDMLRTLEDVAAVLAAFEPPMVYDDDPDHVEPPASIERPSLRTAAGRAADLADRRLTFLRTVAMNSPEIDYDRIPGDVATEMQADLYETIPAVITAMVEMASGLSSPVRRHSSVTPTTTV